MQGGPYCKKCGFDMAGLKLPVVQCPECGDKSPLLPTSVQTRGRLLVRTYAIMLLPTAALLGVIALLGAGSRWDMMIVMVYVVAGPLLALVSCILGIVYGLRATHHADRRRFRGALGAAVITSVLADAMLILCGIFLLPWSGR